MPRDAASSFNCFCIATKFDTSTSSVNVIDHVVIVSVLYIYISMVTNQNRLYPFEQLLRRAKKLPIFAVLTHILFMF